MHFKLCDLAQIEYNKEKNVLKEYFYLLWLINFIFLATNATFPPRLPDSFAHSRLQPLQDWGRRGHQGDNGGGAVGGREESS